ncbi:MAG: bifunctional serine/threonine-protein kinase/ABC transporter substrate-binding protein [Oscillatoriaceae cyanobacterium Prado104]|jgi:ABC-type branched-subunit amino acid transport system substrate-binding protein/tRNA A-37 threonylcarbamoyl transferase component Bud32|nr:bifunctional serine/threonine-protein kinase/ABC transporter substrate-binding protein [Oscillatoriaceae cyanobacterium Prado104]
MYIQSDNILLQPGHILNGIQGSYRIMEGLGEGGFGRTYKAAQMNQPNNPPCVVKEIPFPQSNDPRVLAQARRRFQMEGSALRHLGNNSQIPELFDSFEENNCFYLVQEYIEGHPITQELPPKQRWTEIQTIDFLREVLTILQSIHQEGIVHRDIKPANLIRREADRKIVLIDFGAVREISTFTVNSTGEILTTQAIGTTGYMPAEQYNPRSLPRPYNDIYALGIIAIQALTGRNPNDLPPDPVTNELIWIFPTPDRPAVRISDRFRDILTGMVRYHFQDRYRSVIDILRDLNSIESVVIVLHDEDVPVTQPESKNGNLSITDVLPDGDLQVAQPESPKPWRRWLLLGSVGIAAALTVVLLKPKNQALIPITQTQPTQTKPSPISPLPTQPTASADGVSSGEKLLVQTSALWSKQRGINEFADKNYAESLKLFKQSWREDRRDPETLIYMNNALLKAIGAEYYTIAIVVPIRRNQDGRIVSATLAEELLRGVAQAQTEVNLSLIANRGDRDFPGQGFLAPKSINGKGLKVVIADDANIKSYAVQRANYLVAQPDILAAIGHYTSDMTVETVDIYDRNQLALISPGSTTEELTRKPREYFFRTAPTTSVEAEDLVNQLLKTGQKKVAVFYNPNSPFSASLWEEFTKQFEAKGGKTFRFRNLFDLSKNDFNARAAIEEVDRAGIKAIAILPDGQVTNSLENALEMIKINNNRNWIVGPWTLYEPRTLEIAKDLKSVDKLGISLFWHPLASFDKNFPINAEKLWGGPVNTRSALTYDAAKTLIEALEMQPQPTREGMQKTLAEPNFKAEGATGIIEFDSKTGNRKNPPKRLAHIVPCAAAIYGVTFVPIEFPTAAAAGLKCE